MNSNKTTAIISSAWALAFAVTIFCLCFFIPPAMTAAHEQGTQRVEACAQSGGTWISGEPDICIANK